MKNKHDGFTLAELLIVVAIIGVLVAVSIPVFSQQLEKSREATDLANVRAKYAEVMAEAMGATTPYSISKSVDLKQRQNDWQAYDPVTIGGITHYKSQGDTDHWSGVPGPGGTCTISYTPSDKGIVFTWSGGSAADTVTRVDFSISVHDALNNTDILNSLTNNGNTRFEIDSMCPGSSMLLKVKTNITSNSLLNRGTFAYLGSPSDASGRYLFWTSVDTNVVGAGNKVPIIVSRASGGFYVTTSTTAQRTTKKDEDYVAIADHIYNQYGFDNYTKGTQYNTLQEAYDAYAKLVNSSYPEYKNTLLT